MEQWTKISERFDEWTSPLRPCSEDVAMYENQLPTEGKTLLLGVTPELQDLAAVSVDNNPRMIALHRNNAILGDWEYLPFGPEFDAVIGDGCLTAFQGKPELFFEQAKKVLKKNGRLILRLFISPEEKEDLDFVFERKKEMGFHAFKWRVAQAMANPYVSVPDLYRVMQGIWNHPTLSVYQNSKLVYYFPKLSQLPKWDHIQFGKNYELADRCPVITWIK